MIPAASVEDQELPVTAKRSGVNNPAVAGGGNIRAGAGRDGEAFLGPTDPVRCAEFTDPYAIDRKMQMPACRRECNGRCHSAWVVECREVGPCRILFDGAGLQAGFAAGAVETLLQLADQVLQAVGLVGQVGGVLLLH